MLRLYRLLLRLAPRPLRDAHGDDMTELFADRLAAARAAGGLAPAAVWTRAISDLLRARFASRSPERVPLTLLIDERTAFMAGSDVRYAWRALLRQRGASALAVLMLALGIAANIAVFSIVNGLFLRPFPFPQPDRLVYINTAAPKWNLEVVGINYPDFDRWQKDQKLFEAIAAYQTTDFNVADGSGAERIRGIEITYDFLRVFGVEPILGRSFTAEEDRPRSQPVVLLGEALWRERFGSDRGVLGRSLRLNGVARTIVGVMPRAASFPDDVRLFVPYAGDVAQPFESYGGDAIGRMKPGVTVEQADADIKRAHQPIWDTKDKARTVTPFVRPLHETFVRDYRGAARTVTGAVAVLLLIACANVAAVMLARALARRREMGIRLALGSSRARLIRQLLIENLMLAGIGGAIGLAAGRWALAALVGIIPDQLPRWAAFHLDARVVGFAVLTVVGTVIVFGWAPALHAVGGDLRSAVHATTSGTTASPRGRRTLRWLVAAEFALAAMLLVCGTLLVKAFDRVRNVDPGFRTDGVLVATIPLSEGTRPKEEQWVAFWTEFERRVASIPGVDAAGLTTCAPISGCHLGNFFKVDGALPSPDGKNPVILTRAASPGYFKAIGLRLKEGRFLEDGDGTPQSDGAVVVNESFVRTFWGAGASGAGRRIKYFDPRAKWIPVVGVVADVKHYGLDRPVRPGIYFPLGKMPRSTMMVAVHATVPPASVTPALRDALRQMDPEVPLYRARTMDDQIRRSTALRAALSWMLAVFASLAFVLALGGAYGVSTYLVTQRTREIGIRVALGARTRNIVRSVAATGLGAVLIGVALGVAGSIAVAEQLGDALFGVSARDARVLLGVTAVLILTALLANGLPARRAARVDPMRTLRTDG
ncbi:MAG TPA: ABC transporter permease [Vicinamibacterales bacterium]|nr:ABC transporter permease [Vicinamibacterales bacterium]